MVITSAMVKKAQRGLPFLSILRKKQLSEKLLVSFYRSTVENFLAYCISVCFAGCSVADKNALQRIIKTAEKIIGCRLRSLSDVANGRIL